MESANCNITKVSEKIVNGMWNCNRASHSHTLLCLLPTQAAKHMSKVLSTRIRIIFKTHLFSLLWLSSTWKRGFWPPKTELFDEELSRVDIFKCRFTVVGWMDETDQFESTNVITSIVSPLSLATAQQNFVEPHMLQVDTTSSCSTRH